MEPPLVQLEEFLADLPPSVGISNMEELSNPILAGRSIGNYLISIINLFPKIKNILSGYKFGYITLKEHDMKSNYYNKAVTETIFSFFLKFL
jgi:hypothetical protein